VATANVTTISGDLTDAVRDEVTAVLDHRLSDMVGLRKVLLNQEIAMY
jgi:hypothetical protein